MASNRCIFGSAAVLVALVCVIGANGATPRITMEHGTGGTIAAASGWIVSAPTRDEEMQLTFALTVPAESVATLEETLYAVSDPRHARYGKHLSLAEVNRLTAAPASASATLAAALAFAGAPAEAVDAALDTQRTEAAGGFVSVSLPLSVAEELLECSVAAHEHPALPHPEHGGLRRFLRCEGEAYSLPSSVARVVDFVGGAGRLPHIGARVVGHEVPGVERKLSSSAALQPLPEGNAPLVWPLRATLGLEVLVLPRCPGGAVLSGDVAESCAGGDRLAGITMVSTSVAWSGPGGTSRNHTAEDMLASVCDSCDRLVGTRAGSECKKFGGQYGLSSSTVYCTAYADGPVIGVNTTVNVTMQYSSGGSSDVGNLYGQYPQPGATPAAIRAMYSIPDASANKSGNNSQAVVEFLGQSYSEADLQAYLAQYGTPGSISRIVGPNNSSDPGAEATLDVEVILGLAAGAATEFWSFAGLRNNSAPPSNSNQEPFLAWMMEMASEPHVPWVFSISYDDDEDSMPPDFTDRLNVEFMRAGVRGITLLFAAGDDGVGGFTVRQGGESACPVFHVSPIDTDVAAVATVTLTLDSRAQPAFPASSPYATAVGGTQILRHDPTVPRSEFTSDSVTGSMITTGGGFSSRYAAPTYQEVAVQSYLNGEGVPLPPSHYFNASGRAYPDVSGIATHFPIVLAGKPVLIGGTSASTPLLAAIFTLINDMRFSANKPSVGFVNPALYQMALTTPDAFHDVVFGNNRCSAIPEFCCAEGFYADDGWDATTGLGTPNVAAWLKFFE